MTSIARPKFVLLAGLTGFVLAMTAGSVAYGAADGLVPPTPVAPPAPPSSPVPAGAGRQIVIVEKHGRGNGGESVRTVTRDGSTFIFHTDRALTDAEIEQRISAADARIPPVPPMPVAHGPDRRVLKQRVIVLDEKRNQVIDVVTEDGGDCKGKDVVSDVDTSSEAEGKLTRVRLRICGMPGEIGKQAMADAVDGVRKARDEIARDRDLPGSTRKEALKELDAELARLKRES